MHLNAKFFQFFFWSYYSSSLDLENTIATPNEFFSLKKKKKIFLSPLISLFQSLCITLKDLNVSHNPKTKHKTKSNSYSKVESEQENKKNKKEKEKVKEGTSRFDPI